MWPFTRVPAHRRERPSVPSLSLLSLGILFISAPSASIAQGSPGLAVGSRVRITVPSMQLDSVVGKVTELSSDELVVDFEPRGIGVTTVRRDDITRLEVSLRQERHVGSGVGKGVLLGAGIGAVIGFVSGDDQDTGIMSMSASEKAGFYALTLGFAGAVVGLARGLHKTDVWASVDPGGVALWAAPEFRGHRAALQVAVAIRIR